MNQEGKGRELTQESDEEIYSKIRNITLPSIYNTYQDDQQYYHTHYPIYTGHRYKSQLATSNPELTSLLRKYYYLPRKYEKITYSKHLHNNEIAPPPRKGTIYLPTINTAHLTGSKFIQLTKRNKLRDKSGEILVSKPTAINKGKPVPKIKGSLRFKNQFHPGLADRYGRDVQTVLGIVNMSSHSAEYDEDSLHKPVDLQVRATRLPPIGRGANARFSKRATWPPHSTEYTIIPENPDEEALE